jgi:hypothetical protein
MTMIERQYLLVPPNDRGTDLLDIVFIDPIQGPFYQFSPQPVVPVPFGDVDGIDLRYAVQPDRGYAECHISLLGGLGQADDLDQDGPRMTFPTSPISSSRTPCPGPCLKNVLTAWNAGA